MLVFLEKSKLINTNSIRYDPKYGLGMLNTNIESTQKFMTMAEQSNNKYIIHVDGMFTLIVCLLQWQLGVLFCV